jgi:toxin YoeB
MIKRNLIIHAQYACDQKFWSKVKKTAKKIFELECSILESPESGIGKPERLRGFGDRIIYSRRIDEKNRLIYEILKHEIVS